MGLTVREKEHWKDRIGKRITRRVEALVAKQDPTLLQRVSEEARKQAYESLGIGAQQKELERISEQRAELGKRERRLEAEQRSIIHGAPLEEELEQGGGYPYCPRDITAAVNARAKALEADILAQSELGKHVLALRAEKENLLDTVWLATSSSQIKELWGQVNRLLEATPTELEAKALAIAPIQDE
jgi:hypothetical protein